jgi:hypothetical protein
MLAAGRPTYPQMLACACRIVSRAAMRIRTLRWTVRRGMELLLALGVWLWLVPPAAAQGLIAQSGAAKTGIGWLVVLLGVGLGLLAVCRPSIRKGNKRSW